MNTKPARAQAAPRPKAQATKAPAKERPQDIGVGASPHRDEAVATALSRNAYMRERYEFLLRLIFILLGLLAISLVVNVFYGMRETKMRYFALNPEGAVTEIQVLENPVQSVTRVRSWTTEAVMQGLTLSFANYQQQLADNRLLFTDTGWRSFENALKASRILDSIITQQLVTSVAPEGAPVIRAQGVADGGRYAWVVELPIVVTYESTSNKQSTKFLVTATVMRRPESENPSGLGIAQILVK